ncbi:hypothetical protein NB703_003760 [Pantoea ananatis]|uniref:Uncharacterized protein n=1 Tax=Pantoea ananas TaxID=553 RepID=A0AAJ1D1X1_PANAN|nr:hypothetical protein [Pantoea ananatis]
MNTKSFIDEDEISPDLIFSQMTNETFKAPRPWFEDGVNTKKTVITRLLPEFTQYLIAGIPAIAEYIDAITVRI